MRVLSKALLGFSAPDNQPSMTAHYNPNPNEKMDKHNKLANDVRKGRHHGVKWTVVPLCVEVGARGAINEQPRN